MQFRRGPDHPNWEACFRLPDGSWSNPRSLKTENEIEATFRSVAQYDRVVANGGVKITPRQKVHTFAQAADAVIDQLRQDRQRAVRAGGAGKAHNFNQHLARLRRVLLPAFGTMPVTQITKRIVAEFLATYRVAVRGEQGSFQVPAQSTIGNIGHTFHLVMSQAAAMGWMDHDAIPKLSRRGFARPEPAASFTRQEMKLIQAHMTDEWVAAGHTEIHREHRCLLRAYIALAACSGIRPGEELEGLRVGQVIFERPANEPTLVRVEIRKHQGKHHLDRSAVVFGNDIFDVEGILRHLIARKFESGGDHSTLLFTRICDGKMPVFAVTFRVLLEDLGLRVDPITRIERAPYSCRHYYATEALLRGVDIHSLALAMGTSALMIQRYYSKVTTRMLASELSGNRDTVGRLRAALERQPTDPFAQTDADDEEIYADEARALAEAETTKSSK